MRLGIVGLPMPKSTLLTLLLVPRFGGKLSLLYIGPQCGFCYYPG